MAFEKLEVIVPRSKTDMERLRELDEAGKLGTGIARLAELDDEDAQDEDAQDLSYRTKVAFLLRAPVERPAPEAVARGRAKLVAYPTVTADRVPSVRTQDLFGAPATGLSLPLNRKTTTNARQQVRFAGLEPRQELVPVAGMERYLAVPRRDPPDVVHVVMRDGRDRWLVQEGHTRLAAALLRGDEEMDCRVWEFTEDAAGTFVPVPRGLQRRGLEYRDKLRALAADPLALPAYREKLARLLGDDPSIEIDPEWQVQPDGLTRRFTFENRRQCAAFLAAVMIAANEANHHPDASVSECDVTLTYVTHAAGDTVTEKDYDAAHRVDQILRELPVLLSDIDDDVINLPDISDVSFPSMIGAIPSKPPKKKKRKSVTYKGVRLSRRPMKFEAEILALTEIPPRLDAAVLHMSEHGHETREVMQDIATFGAVEVLHELVRQGAPTSILTRPPEVDVEPCWSRLDADRALALEAALDVCDARVARRHLHPARHEQIVRLLFDRLEPGILKRFAHRAVNDAFIFGRAVTIAAARRPRPDAIVSLAQRDESGKFESIIDAVNAGEIAVDVVVQTAVMDTATCEECEAVDGEEMELGDERQQELHPPYVKCLGWDRCRCVQIAILENGMEIDVDEIDEDTIE